MAGGGIDLSDFDYVFNEFGQLQDFMTSVEQGEQAAGLQFMAKESSPGPSGASLTPPQGGGSYNGMNQYGNATATASSHSAPCAPAEVQAQQHQMFPNPQMQQMFPPGQMQPQMYAQQPYGMPGPQAFQPNGAHMPQQMPGAMQMPMVGPMPSAMMPGVMPAPAMNGMQMPTPYGAPQAWMPPQASIDLQQNPASSMPSPNMPSGVAQPMAMPQPNPVQPQPMQNGSTPSSITFSSQQQQVTEEKKPARRTQQKDQKLQNHSWVEKNRRDRINSLIDELRDLVPATGEFSEASEKNRFKSSIGLYDKHGSDTRPKHIVLRDTVDMVRQLLEKAKLDGTTIKEEQASDPGPGVSTEEQSGDRGASRADADSGILQGSARAILDRDYSGGQAGEQQHHQPSPTTSFQKSADGTSDVPFVSVEENNGAMFVRVQCSDRKGLLSDIIEALKVFPLEIKTAAITTGSDSTVHDVFEVRREDNSPITPQGIQQYLQQYLLHHLSTTRGVGDKRRRMRQAEKTTTEVAA